MELNELTLRQSLPERLCGVPDMAYFFKVKVLSRVFTAKCSETQAAASNGGRGGSGAAEIDEQDTHQIIVIGIAAVVPHNAMADSLMDEISVFVEENTEAEILDELREIR